MGAYYNEIDPYCVAWLRNLIGAKLIADGTVDDRSIKDVQPDDLQGFSQCHFFAGIGGWSYAMRLAGWPDTRSVWTGSCPCQPYSAAGKRRADADDRNLWPEFYRLISAARPSVVFGEQVASADVVGKTSGTVDVSTGPVWLDGIQNDLEAARYTVGAVDLAAAGVGAPHIRQRLWWVADSGLRRCENEQLQLRSGRQEQAEAEEFGTGWGLAQSDGGQSGDRHLQRGREHRQQQENGFTGERLAESVQSGRPEQRPGAGSGSIAGSGEFGWLVKSTGEQVGDAGFTRQPRTADYGFWSDYELIGCIDGKARRTGPGVFPLTHGVSARIPKLRAAGNAIVPQVAAEFIKAFMSCRP